MDLRVQVLGLSYFSIDLALGLRRHTLWSSGSGFARRVAHLLFLLLRCQTCPSLAEEMVFYFVCRRSRFECSAALESLCYGIGFGRLELIHIFFFFFFFTFLFYCFMLLYINI